MLGEKQEGDQPTEDEQPASEIRVFFSRADKLLVVTATRAAEIVFHLRLDYIAPADRTTPIAD